MFCFLITLVVPFLQDWKQIILSITLHDDRSLVALLLSVFGVSVKVNVVELLISYYYIITAFFNLFTAGKVKIKKKESINLFFCHSFLWDNTHGRIFLSYFKATAGAPHQSYCLWQNLLSELKQRKLL
jgi:hypothetical protein